MTRADRATRRRFLVSLGVGAAALAGCAETSDEPRYASGEADAPDGEPRSAEEMAAAEALARREAEDAASPLESLALEDHEFVLEDDYKGPTVQGTVANTGGDLVKFAEVRVRVYDDTGAQLGRFLDSTGDLAAGSTWQFEVILLASVADIADYDVAVLGITG